MMPMDVQSRVAKIRDYMNEKDNFRAVREIRNLIKDNPDLGSTWGSVAQLCQSMDDMDAGLVAVRRYVENKPEDAERQGMLSEFLVATGRIQEALDLMVPYGEKFADFPSVHYGIGVMLSRLGRFEEAEQRFSRVLDLQPSFTLAWEQLAQIHEFTPDDPWVERYKEAEGFQQLLKDQDKPALFYGLGKLYDDLGQYDQAFINFQKGATIKNKMSPFDRENFMNYTQRLINLFTPEKFSQEKEAGNLSERPIFIVGIPRSGTTLVDRIISAHSDVVSGGEMPLFNLASLPFDAQKEGQSQDSYMMEEGASWASIGEDYINRLAERFGSDSRITDKTLANYLSVYAILCALPNAKIIYCRRDPVDTAWSNYRTLFGAANLMSYNLDDIALYQNQYRRLMQHWQTLKPGAILEVDYEQLVSDPERNIKRILNYCDLDVEPDCLNPHKSKAAVSTASFKQVRQPIYKSAIGGAKVYDRNFQPWKQKLQTNGIH